MTVFDGWRVHELIREAIAEERDACARIAENPYCDSVAAFGYDEPSEVGRKIAEAIRERGN